ncbi:MAG: transposase [Gloeomargarita sp. SKYG98]|nr:transposase [Gloeomargarita sp. SKYG98]
MKQLGYSRKHLGYRPWGASSVETSRVLVAACVKHSVLSHIYLPRYSPDLNPIEHVWYRIKQKVRKLQVSAIENLQSLVNETIRSLCQVL